MKDIPRYFREQSRSCPNPGEAIEDRLPGRQTTQLGPAAPDSEEIEAYLDTYVKAAGGSRSRQWRTAAIGAALYALAYTARCEHALEARDPHRRRRRARDTLEADRGRFLAALSGPEPP